MSHTSMRTYQWGMSHVPPPLATISRSTPAHELRISRCKSHVPYINESCRAYKWVISNVWMSHGTHMVQSWRSHVWMSHVTHQHMRKVWLSHTTHVNVTHMRESCHAYEWVMSHIWMSHVTYLKEPCGKYVWVISHMWMSPIISGKTLYRSKSCHTFERIMSHM